MPDGTDGVILELGANDMLRGTDPAVTEKALDAIIAKLKARGIPVMLAGMRAAPNLGPDYGRRFDAIYPRLAERDGLVLYPFFLDGVAGDRSLALRTAAPDQGGRRSNRRRHPAARRGFLAPAQGSLIHAAPVHRDRGPAETGLALTAFRGGLPGARWVEPADYHVTLRFIGDVEGGLAGEITEALAESGRALP